MLNKHVVGFLTRSRKQASSKAPLKKGTVAARDP